MSQENTSAVENELEETETTEEEGSGLKIRTNLKAGITLSTVSLATATTSLYGSYTINTVPGMGPIPGPSRSE